MYDVAVPAVPLEIHMPTSARLRRLALVSCASMLLGAVASSVGCVCKPCMAGPGATCRVISSDGKLSTSALSRSTVGATVLPSATQVMLGASN